ncbi:transcriptional regulator [Salinigranum marinum]|uniref:helix-turn-helix transcriptional regulator n=1 Tax=Salinigranum marinum TaxID=1515595 RepID=UPI002989F28C|nr:transcriptional regulator [Salinigranum marinum]
MESPLEDIEFLARSEHRTAVLDALEQSVRDRADLRMMTGASAPTISRILSDFEERRWVLRNGPVYEATQLGEYVAEEFGELRDAMATERKLRDVWRWLPREMEGFTVDLFADAVVSYPGPGYPYEPVERVTWLIEETTAMRGFGTTVFKSINNETVCLCVDEGMTYEYVYSPEVLRATVSWNPKRVFEAAAHDNCTILVNDALPDEQRCGLGIFDDRIGICCHDGRTGALEAIIDTDAPEAREWAVSVFDRHRAAARPLTESEEAELFPQELVA